MAANVRYTPNRGGMRALGLSSGVGGMCVDAANRGRVEAERIAPRDSSDYATSFQVRQATVRAGWGNEPRAGAVLVNTSDHAAAVEWRHGHHVLARVVDTIEGS